MSSQQSGAARGWTVVLAGLSINLVLGVLYAWGVIAKALVVELRWTKTEAGLPFAASTAAFALMMVFAGRMQDKIGPRRIAGLGGVLLGLGLIASSRATSPVIMMLTFGVVGGVGIGLGYSATTPAAIKWFSPERRGIVTGIVVSGVGLAAVYMSPLTQALLARTTVANVFALLGVGTIVAVLVLSRLLSDPPRGYQPVPSGGARRVERDAAGGRPEVDWRDMMRTPQVYCLWLMYVLAAAAGLMVISNAAIIAKEQAHWEAGFVPVMVLAIFNTTGRVLAGYVSDRIGRTPTLLLAFALQAGNMLCFSRYGSPALLVFGAAFTGLCYGTLFTLMPAATADLYGTKNLGVNYGIVFTGFGVAGVLGSILGGRVRDLLGSYAMAYAICAGLLALAALLAYATHPRATPA